MACGACGSKARAYSSNGSPARVLHQVVLDGGKGRVAFQTHDAGQARAVARSYPGSIVRQDGDTTAAGTAGGAETTSGDPAAPGVTA